MSVSKREILSGGSKYHFECDWEFVGFRQMLDLLRRKQ